MDTTTKIRTLARLSLALIFSVATVYLAIAGDIEGGFVAGAASSIIGFYFGEKAAIRAANGNSVN